jgi:hypothetical protein
VYRDLPGVQIGCWEGKITVTDVATVERLRVPKPDYRPEAEATFELFRPLWEQEKTDKNHFALQLSGVQWKQAYILANVSAEAANDVMVWMSQKLNIKKATLELRRKVGKAFPEGTTDPQVSFGAYVELFYANPEDRQKILDGLEPDERTVDGVRAAVRARYSSDPAPENLQRKSMSLDGFGRISVVITKGAIKITLPKSLDVTAARYPDETILTADLKEKKAKKGAD